MVSDTNVKQKGQSKGGDINMVQCQAYGEISGARAGKKRQSKGRDINMVQCQAYGEVGVKMGAGDDEVNKSSGFYEDI